MAANGCSPAKPVGWSLSRTRKPGITTRVTAYLVTYSGTLISGAEQFVHTIAVDYAGGTDATDVLNDAVTALGAFLDTSGVRGLFRTTTVWTNVKVAAITNLSTGALFAGINQAVTQAGSAATGATPAPQLSLVVSTVGGPSGNGTPYRGRFHLPAIAINGSQGDNGLITAANQTTLLNGIEAWMTALTVGTRSPQVWSRKDGLTSTITAVRLGRQFDTIRSRRRDMPELYSTRTL